MSETLLEAKRLTKRFPIRGSVFGRALGQIHAVTDVNLAIAPGDSVGLVGESGCGKSTLARVLVGLLEPTAGEVLIGGRPLGQLAAADVRQFRREVQLVFQDPTNSLNPRLRVRDLVAEPLVIHRLARGGQLEQRVDELLQTVQLSPSLRDRRPRDLSGGERQRVGLARALATDPRLLICDEPIASLDVSVGAQILELLHDLQRQRALALLFISHDLRAVAYLCERIAVMYLGHLVELAPTHEILDHPWHPYTELLLRSASLELSGSDAGERPSRVHPPSGCVFRTRCPLAESVCERDEPALLEKASQRQVACHKRP